MGQVSFIKWIGAAAVLVVGIAVLEQWNERVAWTLAVLILLAAFFRYPAAASEIRKLLQGG